MAVRRLARALGAAAIATGTLLPLLAAGPAAAASPKPAAPPGCDAVVTDLAHVLHAADRRRLTTQAESLAGMVRVVTVARVPHADLDGWERTRERACGWTTAGHRTTTLLAVVLDTGDRRNGIYFGARYDDALSGWRSITADAAGALKEQRWADGLSGELYSIGQAIESPSDPATGQPGDGSADGTMPGPGGVSTDGGFDGDNGFGGGGGFGFLAVLVPSVIVIGVIATVIGALSGRGGGWGGGGWGRGYGRRGYIGPPGPPYDTWSSGGSDGGGWSGGGSDLGGIGGGGDMGNGGGGGSDGGGGSTGF